MKRVKNTEARSKRKSAMVEKLRQEDPELMAKVGYGVRLEVGGSGLGLGV